jgi:hypothetical protein
MSCARSVPNWDSQTVCGISPVVVRKSGLSVQKDAKPRARGR